MKRATTASLSSAAASSSSSSSAGSHASASDSIVRSPVLRVAAIVIVGLATLSTLVSLAATTLLMPAAPPRISSPDPPPIAELEHHRIRLREGEGWAEDAPKATLSAEIQRLSAQLSAAMDERKKDEAVGSRLDSVDARLVQVQTAVGALVDAMLALGKDAARTTPAENGGSEKEGGEAAYAGEVDMGERDFEMTPPMMTSDMTLKRGDANAEPEESDINYDVVLLGGNMDLE